ncbi:DUF3108 domain-containing protein [Thiohalorhabdus methylotrophus]|uniref:DUF3108 domain-containing protein n=1 Tax=Thiohalorhabdus methylotrophus TaxID=3242694 RepID=A0ABV4TTU8_9GAMM
MAALPVSFLGRLLLFGLLSSLLLTSKTSASPGPESWEIQFEELRYEVSWAGMKAGKGMFRARPTEEGLILRAQICSTGWVDALHSVRDQIYTRARVEDGKLVPEYHRVTQIEGGSTKETVLEFLTEHRVMFERKGREKLISVPPGVLEVLTAIYSIRRMPLEVGVTHRVPLIDGKDVKMLVVPVEGRTKEGGEVVLEVRPYTVGEDGERDGGKNWELYLSQEGRIPVRMKLELSFGTLHLRLTGVRDTSNGRDGQQLFCDKSVRMPR